MTTALPSFRPVMNRIAGLITQLYWVSARGWVTLSSFLLTCAGVGSPWCKPAQRYPEEPGATQRGTEGHRGTPRDTEGHRGRASAVWII